MKAPKVSESKRRANIKWDKENMATLGCRVKRDEADAFKEYAKRNGKTANTVLKEFVLDCINEDSPKTGERDNMEAGDE